MTGAMVLQDITTGILALGAAGIFTATRFVQGALRSQQEARALLDMAWARYLELAARPPDVWLVVVDPGGLFGAYLDEDTARRAAEAVGGVLVGLNGEAYTADGVRAGGDRLTCDDPAADSHARTPYTPTGLEIGMKPLQEIHPPALDYARAPW